MLSDVNELHGTDVVNYFSEIDLQGLNLSHFLTNPKQQGVFYG